MNQSVMGSFIEGGTETILLVEDETLVRDIASRTLRASGYHILAAEDGVDALTVAEKYAGHIHLLLTDVVMPRMSGAELAEQLQSRRPGIRTLYFTGYTEEEVIRYGLRIQEVDVILKPFSPDQLAVRVRNHLDAPA